MSIIENLSHTEGIEKLKSLAEDKICFFITHLPDGEIDTRPMSTLDVDDQGTFWFFCKDDSEIAGQIKENSRVDLLYGNNNNNSYLFVKAQASLLRDQEIIDRLWNPVIKAWFEEGKDDPTIQVIKVEPDDIHYTDTQHGKFISGIKIMVAAVTGNAMDDGRQGTITL